MVPEEYKELVDQFKKQGKMRFLEAVTEEQIEHFERENGIQLPAKYREWLKFSDGGELFLPAGVQMYGVAHKPLIDVDDNNKPDNGYIVIGALATGDPILCEKNGERISIYNHEVGRIEEDESYEDFISFIKDLYDLLGIGE